ncbi:MAG: hypothetical protein OXG46_06050 [Chloroflexi bacterium]|nr:hypothetical protein [Chloroflexota bacterium]
MPVRRVGGQTGPVHTGGSYAKYVEGPLSRLAAARGMAVPLPDPGDPAEISDAPPIRTVFLHEDRWVVQCPGCARDYSLAWPVEGLYMCPACWNGAGIHPHPNPLPSRERESRRGQLGERAQPGPLQSRERESRREQLGEHPAPGPLPSRERERSRGGLYLRVAMPDGWERVDREAGRAPDPRLRNWIPTGAGLKGMFESEPEQTAEEVIKEFSRYD